MATKQKVKELELKHLQRAFYLTGWKLFVWRLFIRRVYPDWVEGHRKHQNLIAKGLVAHPKEYPNCSCTFKLPSKGNQTR